MNSAKVAGGYNIERRKLKSGALGLGFVRGYLILGEPQL